MSESKQLMADEVVLGVGELTQRIKDVLEDGVRPCWVRGEVSNMRVQASGHIYFSLKDEDAQISAVLFKGNARTQGSRLKEGTSVILYGELSVYAPRGTYQLIVRHVLKDGVGKLQREFERLKAQLLEEGLFDTERKKPIPQMPKAIGVITSPTGAALQDFIRILRRRDWRGRLVVLPVRVQGKEATGEVVEALKVAEQMGDLELLVITRGGGSLEDLWPFNEEILVRAASQCALPVVSAIGHETDVTLLDFVADKRAETPSGAAELISSAFVERYQKVKLFEEAMLRSLARSWERACQRWVLCKQRMRELSPARLIEEKTLRLDDLRMRMGRCAADLFHSKKSELADVQLRLNALSPQHALSLVKERVGGLKQRLENLKVEATLGRGFALVQEEAHYFTASKGVAKGDAVRIVWKDGERAAQILD